MNRRRWSVHEVVEVCSVFVAIPAIPVAIPAIPAVLLLPGNVIPKVAACVGTFAAFWWGRAQGWEDASTRSDR